MFAGLDLAAGTDESGPVVGGKLLGEKDFDAASGIGRAGLRLSAAGAGGVEAGGENAAIVEDEEVAVAQDSGEIAKKKVVVVAGVPVEQQHAAGAANRRWGLGDQLFGKVEMEVGYAHSMVILVVQNVVKCVVNVVSSWCFVWLKFVLKNRTLL